MSRVAWIAFSVTLGTVVVGISVAALVIGGGERSAAQPRKARTFGSVFKNPPGDMGAGRMLEACGLKGFQIGGARVSPVHANFIENTGDARSADVAALIREGRRRARERFGVELEHEVELLGPISLD